MCNRVGAEGEAIFCGESTVVDPYGNLVAKGTATESLITADIDLSHVAAARAKRPYLPLRRHGRARLFALYSTVEKVTPNARIGLGTS